MANSGTRDCARDHRQARAHGLEQNQAERLGAFDRRQAENVRARIGIEQCRVASGVHIDAAGEAHARADAKIGSLALQRYTALSIANQHQRCVRAFAQRAQQHVEALEEAQSPDRKDTQSRARP